MVTLSSRRERIEQLAGVLDGSLPADQARSDVRRLATLASTVTEQVELPQLEAAERDRIRTRVMAAVHTDLQAAATEQTRGSRAPRTARAAVATGVASVLIGASGVTVAAQEALPGEALYSLKQATESVRTAAAGDLTEQGRLELTLAAERLAEIGTAVERGGVRDEALIDTFARMDARTRTGAEALVRVAERSGEDELLDEVARFTQVQAAGITELFDRLPVDVRPHAEDSLANLRAVGEDLLAPLRGGADVGSAELATSLRTLLRSSPLPPLPRAEPTPDRERAPTPTEAPVDTGTEEPTEPAPTRSPSLPLPSSPAPTTGGGNDDERTLVPRLPGPLDRVGESVDDAVGGVLDGTGELLEDTTGAVDDVVDEVGEGVEGLLDGALGTVGGLLGGASAD